MKKNKLYFQITACLFLGAAFVCGSAVDNRTFAGYYARVKDAVMEQMTMEDVKEAGAYLKAELSDAPSKMVSAVTEANRKTRYGAPMDEDSGSKIKQVHAAAGGMVTASGKDKARGLYIEIKHDDAVSVYGQLADINVVEDERVQRGEIIGSYDTGSEHDFFYELRENL